MTVRIELKPEVEATLAAQAAARGMALDAFIERLVEDHAHAGAPRYASPEALEAMLDKLAEMGKDLPPLPSSAFTRESIYRDHD